MNGGWIDDAGLASAFIESGTRQLSRMASIRQKNLWQGEVDFAQGNYESAMGHFLDAKGERSLQVRAGHLLGRCFAEMNWHKEAIDEYREALYAIDRSDEGRQLDIRYDLMASLVALARAEHSLDLARDALDICSVIARKQITYRDIRNRRREIDQLIREITSGPAGAEASSGS